MKKLLFGLLLFNVSLLVSQTPGFQWVRYTGAGARAYGIAHDKAGNIYVTGHFEDTLHFLPPAGTQIMYTEYQRAFILKMRPDGSLVWLKDDYHLEGIAIAVDNDANVFITGYRGYITKLDSAGNILWTKNPVFYSSGDAKGWCIAVDASGNVYGSGGLGDITDFDPGPSTFTLTPNGPRDAYIWKLDGNGNFVWAKNIGGGQCEARSICIDRAGNVLTSGYFINQIDCDPGPSAFTLLNNNYAAFILKLDQNGNFVWGKDLGGNYAFGHAICTDSNNDVYTAGEFIGTNDFDPGSGSAPMSSNGGMDAYISKLNASGNFVWKNRFGSKFGQGGRVIKCDASDDVWIGGYFRDSIGFLTDFDPGPGVYQVSATMGSFIVKLDKSGNFKTCNFTEDRIMATSLNNICITDQANVYATGYFNGDIVFNPGPIQNTVSVSLFGEHVFIYKLNDVTVGIADIQQENAIALYPNPAKSNLYINQERMHTAHIKIFSTEGQLKIEQDLDHTTQLIDVSALHKGIYILQLEENNTVRTAKFVKE